MNKHLWIEFYDKELVDYCSLLVQRHRIVVMIMITVVFGQRKYAVNLYIHHHNHHLYVLCIKYGEALSKTFTTMFILQRYFKGFLPMTELSTSSLRILQREEQWPPTITESVCTQIKLMHELIKILISINYLYIFKGWNLNKDLSCSSQLIGYVTCFSLSLWGVLVV